MKVFLSKLHWDSINGIHVTGYIWEEDKYLCKNRLIDYFSEIDSIEKFEQKLKHANGQFSVIIESSDKIWAATDRLRNYPLFYTKVNGEILISDDCYRLAELIPEQILDPLAVNSFLSAGYTINNLTLLHGVFQVEAGELIQVNSGVQRKYYFNSSLIPLSVADFESASGELISTLDSVFEKYFYALKNKFVVIPLSGGFDSRLIALMCKKYHRGDVLCYTYGTENNCEVAPAREVASRLGLRWINIIYNNELIDGYLEDDTFKKYYPYASDLSSMFFMQEYFAVKYLKESGIIPDDSVFIPGFSGDILAGSHLSMEMKNLNGIDKLSEYLFNNYLDMMILDKKSKTDIAMQIKNNLFSLKNEAWRVIWDWDIKERQAKFVVNSAKVFTFFGYEYVMPFFDSILMDFFSSLPFSMRINKRLYDYVMTEFIFRETDLNLHTELNPKPVKRNIQRIIERIKYYIPGIIKEHLIKRGSPIYYDQVTKYMIEDLGRSNIRKPRQSNYYNSYIAQWYLARTRENLSPSFVIKNRVIPSIS